MRLKEDDKTLQVPDFNTFQVEKKTWMFDFKLQRDTQWKSSVFQQFYLSLFSKVKQETSTSLNRAYLWLYQLFQFLTFVCFRCPLLVYFLLFSLLSCSHQCFLVDREVGGVSPLPCKFCRPITKQHSPPPGRYERPSSCPISRVESECRAAWRYVSRAACGPRVGQHGRRAAGGGGGGDPTLDSWKLSELQTLLTGSRLQRMWLIHNPGWLRRTKAKRASEREREKKNDTLHKDTKRKNHLTCVKIRSKDGFTFFCLKTLTCPHGHWNRFYMLLWSLVFVLAELKFLFLRVSVHCSSALKHKEETQWRNFITAQSALKFKNTSLKPHTHTTEGRKWVLRYLKQH